MNPRKVYHSILCCRGEDPEIPGTLLRWPRRGDGPNARFRVGYR